TTDKNSKGEVQKLYFEFDEFLSLVDLNLENVDSNLSLLNKENNQTPAFTDIFTPTDIELATDGKTVIVTVNETVSNGDYEVTVEEGFVQDDAAGNNDSQRVTKDLFIGEAENLVEAEVVVEEGTNDFTVTFNQDVTAESAKN